MRIYSVRDMTVMVEELLKGKGFSIERPLQSKGSIEATQRKGIVSQTFRVTIKQIDQDPL